MLQHGRLPYAQCLEIGVQLATALQHLHDHGLVHRDIKPSNIVFVNGIPKLADIGSVARMRRIEERLRFVQRAGALVTALAAVIALGWWWQAKQTGEMRELAENNRRIAEERTTLADEKAILAEENRERLVRLSVANGVRLLDDNDPTGALLWFAQALPLVVDRPAEEEIHRIRIQQTLNRLPRLERLIGHWTGRGLRSAAFSPDGRTIATVSAREIRLWSTETGVEQAPAITLPYGAGSVGAGSVRFSNDGARLMVLGEYHSNHSYFGFNNFSRLASNEPARPTYTAILDAFTGEPLSSPITNAAIALLSSDARWLAVTSEDGNVSVIDTADGREVTERIRHGDWVLTMAFSEDSQFLVTGGRDHVARIWRIPSGDEVGSGLVHQAPVVRAVFRSDAQRLATAECESNRNPAPCRVRVWDLSTGLESATAKQTDDWVWALFFEPGPAGRLLVGLGASVQVLNPESLTEVLPALQMNSHARCWTFTSDARAVVVGSDDSMARIWELERGTPLLPPFPHNGWVEWVGFSPDGERLLTTSDDGLAKVWSLDGKPESARLDLPANHHEHWTSRIVRRRTGLIPVHLDNGSVALLDSGTMALERVVAPSVIEERICESHESPRGRWLALVDHHRADSETSETPHTVNLWQVKEGGLEPRAKLPHPDHIFAVEFWEDSSEFITVDTSLIRSWGVSDGTLIRSLPLPAPFQPIWGNIMPESITPDGRRILLWRGHPSQDWTLQLFDVGDAELIGPAINVTQLAHFPNLMRFSPDGTRLAMVGADQMGTIIDLATGELAAPRFKHGGNLLDLDWSPDGTRLITTGLAPNIKMWNAATGELLLAPMDLPTSAPARSAQWSADGRFVVGRNDGKVARVWDAATAEPVTPILVHEGAVHWACVTPGNRLITASGANLVRAWDLKPSTLPSDSLADYVALMSGRRLTASGVMLGIPAAELAELHRSLLARHPELFSPATARD